MAESLVAAYNRLFEQQRNKHFEPTELEAAL